MIIKFREKKPKPLIFALDVKIFRGARWCIGHVFAWLKVKLPY